MIFLFSLYPEHPVSEFRNSEAILSKNGISYTIKIEIDAIALL